jgi:hypothetical protein
VVAARIREQSRQILRCPSISTDKLLNLGGVKECRSKVKPFKGTSSLGPYLILVAGKVGGRERSKIIPIMKLPAGAV